MAGNDDAQPVAVIGSPSSTTEVMLNVLRDAYTLPVYGQLVAFMLTLDTAAGTTRKELCLGTVTSVQTVNAFHTATALEAGRIAEQGHIPNKSGHDGDIRSIRVGVEAVFRYHDGNGWLPAGSTLSNSPQTGTPVRLVDQRLVDTLLEETDGKRYIGRLRGTDVLVPYTLPDFSGRRGSAHAALAGATGAGKTMCMVTMLAGDLYHERFGQIIIDPQGQFASEHGMVFSLQGLAAACGRTVHVARIARTLRLRKDAPMLLDLLAKVGVFTELGFGAGADAQVANACRVMEDALDDKKALTRECGTNDWTEADPDRVTAYVLESLREALPLGTVYAGAEGQKRVAAAIRRPAVTELIDTGEAADPDEAQQMIDRMRPGILDQRPTALDPEAGKRWRTVSLLMGTVHNLWSPYTPEGATRVWREGADPATLSTDEKRVKAWPLLREVFAPATDRPAPWLILDVSSDPAAMPGFDADDDDGAADQIAKASAVLDSAGVKARIMRQLIGDVVRAGEAQFKGGQPLNTRITVDEASLFAADADPAADADVNALSELLEVVCHTARKLGVGLTFICQTLSSLRANIWKQCTLRVIGYGLTDQQDLRKLENVIGTEHVGLYRAQAGPDATGRYPFMFSGGNLTGLSFGPKPVFLEMFTEPADFLHHNEEWLTPLRRTYVQFLPEGDHGQPLTTMPARPKQGTAAEIRYHRQGLHKAAANQPAAKALNAVKTRTPNGGFGWTPKRTEDPTWGDLDNHPPF